MPFANFFRSLLGDYRPIGSMKDSQQTKAKKENISMEEYCKDCTFQLKTAEEKICEILGKMKVIVHEIPLLHKEDDEYTKEERINLCELRVQEMELRVQEFEAKMELVKKKAEFVEKIESVIDERSLPSVIAFFPLKALKTKSAKAFLQLVNVGRKIVLADFKTSWSQMGLEFKTEQMEIMRGTVLAKGGLAGEKRGLATANSR